MKVFEELKAYSPDFLKLLAKRGLELPDKIEAYLSADLSFLYDPFLMKGMREAVVRIQKAIAAKESILIHGDYDVDGVTSSAILSRTFDALKLKYTAFLPERSRDGYGVSERAIREGAARSETLLVTADCGITAHEKIKIAKELGMDVIVIDHHRIPPEGIPEGAIILNPQQTDCPYPFKELSAGGLAFKLSQALVGTQAYQWLDLAALSTVADIAPLKDENRIIVKHGLKHLSQNPNLGLRVLSETAKIRAKEMNTGHLGFMIGPRINACGRMSTPDTALRLLVTDSKKEAECLAAVLEEENKVRQKEERQTVKEAVWEVERSVNFNKEKVIVVGREGWHQGVVGIVASRLVDRFSRPAVVIGFENGKGKGSGRSIKGFNLFEALSECRGAMEEFGGHEQAVGLSIKKDNLQRLKNEVNEYVSKNCGKEMFVKKINPDLEISLADLKSLLIYELQMMEPFGAGNPRPVFLTRNLTVHTKPAALSVQQFRFFVTDGSRTLEAVWRDRTDKGCSWIKQGDRLDIYYSVKLKVWDGMESFVLDTVEIKPAAG